jgi:tetratricopeptide (TPR) repeat protein
LCLEHRVYELASLEKVLARADSDVVENAEAAVGALTPPKACADGASLRAMVRPPNDPTLRAAHDRVRLELNEGTALFLSGKYAQGLATAERATGEARALDFLPLVAETLFVQSRLYDKTGELAKAESTVHQAIVAAEASGHDEIAGRGWSLLAGVVGARQARHQEGHLWAEHASAVITKLGDRPEELAALRNFEGSISLSEGDYERARAAYQEALTLR